MTAAGSPFALGPDGIRVALRVSPKAAASRVEGTTTGADGGAALKVRVAAPPVDGAANAALVKLLAKAWGLPKSRLALVAGEAARAKTLLIAGGDAAELDRLEAWRTTLG